MRVVLSCEHARPNVPRRYARLFRGTGDLMQTHRACDWGALPVARALRKALRAPLFEAEVTRLLIDLNRPLEHPRVFSELSRVLDEHERQALIQRYHAPHWQRVRSALQAARGPRLHLSVHSFTPVLDGDVRRAQVGLLYDPRRPRERELCARWAAAIARAEPRWKVRRNYPYKGVSQGLTTHLRQQLGPDYLGVELELNQALLAAEGVRVRRVMVDTLSEVLRARPSTGRGTRR